MNTMQFDNYTIRLICADDAQNYFNLIDKNRKRLEDFFAGTVARNKDIDGTKVFIADALDKIVKRTYFPFVIIDSTNLDTIGYIDIKSIDWNIPKAEAGFFIDEKYEGKGIITKAFSKIIAHCFETLELNKLLLRTHEKNTGSRRVAEKNNFEVEGIIRSDYKTTSGVVVDLMYYGLLRTKNK